jgi:hypothetical protein
MKMLHLLLLFCCANAVLGSPLEEGRNIRVLIIAGIHGDEPAPSIALDEMLNDGTLRIQGVLVLNHVNSDGLGNNTREDSHGRDLNRIFRTLRMDDEPNPSVKQIHNLIVRKQVGLILDLHEGYYFRQQQTCTVSCNCPLGNTIFCSKEAIALDRDGGWREAVLQAANSSVISDKESYVMLDYICPKRSGTLREFASLHNLPYVLVEVARGGIAAPYPVCLEARKQQIRDVVTAALATKLPSQRFLLRR